MMMAESLWITDKDWRYNKLNNYGEGVATDLWNACVELNSDKVDTDKDILWYEDLEKEIKTNPDYKEYYYNMPTTQSAQQLIKLYASNVKGTLKARKAYHEDSTNFTGYPQFPKRKGKHNLWAPIIFTNQNAKLDGNIVRFPKILGGVTVKTKFIKRYADASLRTVTFIKRKRKIGIVMVFKIKEPRMLPQNKRVMGIDLGVNNLAACATNIPSVGPFIITGLPIKAANQWYNKQLAHFKEIVNKRNISNKRKKELKAIGKNPSKWSKRLDAITDYRNNFVTDYMHKTSRLIIDYCVAFDIREIIIGHNKLQKQHSGKGKKFNQTFVQIPFCQLIQQLEYKGKLAGIKVITHEESYTSKSSFLNKDPIPRWKKLKKGVKRRKHKFSGRRVHRGLFKTVDGVLINADINAALNIIRKSKRNAFSGSCSGVTLAPVIVDSRVHGSLSSLLNPNGVW